MLATQIRNPSALKYVLIDHAGGLFLHNLTEVWKVGKTARVSAFIALPGPQKTQKPLTTQNPLCIYTAVGRSEVQDTAATKHGY